ncbi:hypothetical protein CIG75_11905 [Tumebacillus algifaecis]|uniref:DUF2802 domain-containing protein n=1 Tax=Tumebacillus algifaecis TaxID=1214604 RepID=A0A223D2F9_9BACL|nr:hypothetical protein [Tumebacillus algifaecis]ASS75623.1 hypothetical protein CIG75_11905 [Tumebacillus algifaecis]
MGNQLYLYVALIGLALVLFALTRPKGTTVAQSTDLPTPSKAVDQELKDLLDDFMNDLERDNVKLIDSFTKLKNEHTEQIAEQNEIIRALEDRVNALEAQLLLPMPTSPSKASVDAEIESSIKVSDDSADMSSDTVVESAKPAFVMQEKYAQVLAMSRLGMPAEQIARETGIGVGEILLVVGLAKRGEG